ncbi:hypothetical protein ACFQ3P_43495 [Paraburkholderia sabiae]|uniref:Uncharacterized protein n=1 Tax=Paraburkholderia sabiae TaxID=273251 RepID=A0ABU9QSR8_9BURK|nr:hypothetical protein [Paraburkholderia sabiae]WJZ79869.1 hypothetical protein QEN71_44500 [Paraburkholderia sabiae]
MDPALAHLAFEQRKYRALQRLLQDVHSLISFLFEGEENRRPATLFSRSLKSSAGGSQVEKFELPIPGVNGG